MNRLDVGLQVHLNQLGDLSSHSTDLTNLEQKVNFFDFLTFCSRLVESVEWLDRSPSHLSEPVALYLIYSYLKF